MYSTIIFDFMKFAEIQEDWSYKISTLDPKLWHEFSFLFK